MEPLTVEEITRAVRGRLSTEGNPAVAVDSEVNGTSTDSRKIRRGEIFFAIAGKSFDGHDFAARAFALSGIPVVVSRCVKGIPCIVVEDTLTALGDLAREYRRKLGKKTIAVTGTNGKTTTKEMAACVLRARYRVRKNRGNMNNLVGLPLSVLEMDKEDDLGVFEMGMSERGEIGKMCGISEPSVGVITNVGPCHLESLGTVEQVALAKSELIEYLGPDHEAVLNFDDPFVRRMARTARARVTGYGIKENARIRAKTVSREEWGMSFSLESGESFRISLPGVFNVYNALAAIGVGMALGVRAEEAGLALAAFLPEKHRMTRVKLNGVTIIDDSYNANPVSVECALEVLSRTPAKRRIVVLGDMLELGAASELEHRRLGRRMKALNIDVLFVYGSQAIYALDSARGEGLARVAEFTEKRALTDALKDVLQDGDVVLVKGSRAMGMEEVAEALVEFLRKR